MYQVWMKLEETEPTMQMQGGETLGPRTTAGIPPQDPKRNRSPNSQQQDFHLTRKVASDCGAAQRNRFITGAPPTSLIRQVRPEFVLFQLSSNY
jgi:hypothetical protein